MRSKSDSDVFRYCASLGSAIQIGLGIAENSGEPVDLAQQVAQALLVVGLGEDELLLPAAVVARGDGHGLAVAGLHELQLAHVDGFAHRVVDEGLGVGLLHRWHDLSERERDGGGDFRVQAVRSAVGQLQFAVNDVGVGAGGRLVKGPREFFKGQRQSAQGHVALGARIAQALGFARQVRGHLRQQIRLVKIESFTQLKLQGAAGNFISG